MKGKGNGTSYVNSTINVGGNLKTNSENLTLSGANVEADKVDIKAKNVVIESKQDKSENKDSTYGVGFSIDLANPSNFSANINGSKGNGEAEDLGFNTNKDKAQEVTKDEERHLDAELHTDLIGEDKRNEIKYAYKKLGSLKEILDQKKFKESMEGILVDKFKDEHQKEFNLIKEESLSLEDKQKLAQNLVERYLRENGYEGVTPEVLLTDEAHSFTVDSKDKETGAKRREKIYFSINDIANPDLAFSKLFAHEKAHMNTYDEGKDGEETSIHTREKVGSENKNKVFTEEEKADYLNSLRNKYKDQKSIEQQFAEAKLVPEKDKENFVPAIAIGGTVLIYRYGPVVIDLINKYGPVIYEFLSNPQNYQWAQVLIDNPELFATKDAIIKYIEEVKDKGEKLEEAREGQKQEKSSGSSQSPDPNKNKPDKDFNKVNLEDTVNEVTKGVIKHSYNGHSVEKIIEQLSKRPYESMVKYLKNNTFFNPNWGETEVKEAAKLIYKSALNDGFSQKYYEITYLGEKVTGYFENGIFKSLYGNYKFTYGQLVDFATKRGI